MGDGRENFDGVRELPQWLEHLLLFQRTQFQYLILTRQFMTIHKSRSRGYDTSTDLCQVAGILRGIVYLHADKHSINKTKKNFDLCCLIRNSRN